MIIDLKNMQAKEIQSFKGGLLSINARLYSDQYGKIMYGRLVQGASIGMHTHDTSSETIYVLSGKGKVLYDDTVEYLEEGDCSYCPKGHSHSLINESPEDLVFFAVIPEL